MRSSFLAGRSVVRAGRGKGDRVPDPFCSIRGERMSSWCDKGEHGGPYFTVTALAMEVGPFTGRKGYHRIQGRQVLARLCWQCLRTAVLRVEGVRLISQEAQDPANG